MPERGAAFQVIWPICTGFDLKKIYRFLDNVPINKDGWSKKGELYAPG
jgi:hypothetical protein